MIYGQGRRKCTPEYYHNCSWSSGGGWICTREDCSHQHLASPMPLKSLPRFEGPGKKECLHRALGKPPELWNAEQAAARPAGMRLERWNRRGLSRQGKAAATTNGTALALAHSLQKIFHREKNGWESGRGEWIGWAKRNKEVTKERGQMLRTSIP